MTNKEKIIQTDLFGIKVKEKEVNKIEDHWINMPEYNNVNRQKPYKIAIVKFRNEDDFKEFSRVARELIFNGELHWGSFKSNVRVAWYPPFDKASNYVYVDEEDEEDSELTDDIFEFEDE